MGLFIEKPTPFLEEYLTKIAELDYPKEKMCLLVHNAVLSFLNYPPNLC